MFKAKGKEKPGPTCWLFLGSGQNIGGYTNVENARDEAWEQHYTNASIYADPQGETLLYYQDRNPEKRFDCGCVTQKTEWHDAQKEHSHLYLIGSRTELICTGSFCKNMNPTGIDLQHMGSMERAQRLIEHPPLRTVTAQW